MDRGGRRQRASRRPTTSLSSGWPAPSMRAPAVAPARRRSGGSRRRVGLGLTPVSFGDYAFGVIGLALVAIPMAMGGVRLRGRLLPGWVGAPARLAEAVLAVALLTILLQLLGAFGILVPGVLIPAALLLGLGLYYGVRGAFSAIRRVKRHARRSPRRRRRSPFPSCFWPSRPPPSSRPTGRQASRTSGLGGCSPSTRSGTTGPSRRASRTPARSGGCTSPIPST